MLLFLLIISSIPLKVICSERFPLEPECASMIRTYGSTPQADGEGHCLIEVHQIQSPRRSGTVNLGQRYTRKQAFGNFCAVASVTCGVTFTLFSIVGAPLLYLCIHGYFGAPAGIH